MPVGAVVTLDAHLQVGATQEIVDVSADAPVVETTRSQTSTVVNQKAIADLPINGRNFLDFAVLTPGVVRDPSRGGDLSFGGQRGTANSLTVDGSDANNVFFGQSTGRAGTGRSPYSFSQDAVQEFQVSANGYAAEVGRAGGGVINVITKSGTNDWHGTAFEFFRDKALNANSWENNRAAASQAQLSLQSVRRKSGRSDRQEQGVLLLRLRRAAKQRADYGDPGRGGSLRRSLAAGVSVAAEVLCRVSPQSE